MPSKLSSTLFLVMLAGLSAAALEAIPLPAGTEIHVNAGPGGRCVDPSVAVFPDGGFVVVWTNGPESGPTAIHARLFTSAGNPASGELLLTPPTTGSQHADQVVADRNGTFLVAWTEKRGPIFPGGSVLAADVYVRRFRRNGTPKGKPILVNVDRTYISDRARLAVGADGRFAVTWNLKGFKYDFFFDNAMARLFRADGTAFDDGFLVSPGDPEGDSLNAVPTGVALEPDGGLSVLYEWRVFVDVAETFLAHYSRRGGKTRDLRVSSDHQPNREGSSLAMAPDGSLWVTWSDFSEVVAHRLTAQGIRLGGPVTLSNRYVDRQTEPKLVALPHGGFVAVWTEAQRDGDGNGIFSRVFAADGSATRDFRLNVTTAGDQRAPAVAANLAGPVVVVWQQDERDIFARLLTSPPAAPE